MRYGIVIVGASAVGMGLSQASIMNLSFGVFITPLSEAFGWGRGAISLALTLSMLTLALVTPTAGRMLDRLSVRRTLIICAPLYGLAFGLLSTVDNNILYFYFLFCVAAALGSGTNSIAYTRVVSQWFDKRRGLALGISMCGVGVASILIPPIGQALITRHGWPTAYITFAAIATIGIPLMALTMREPVREQATRAKSAEAQAAGPIGGGTTSLPLKRLLASREFVLLCLIFMLLAFGLNAVIIHLVPALIDAGFTGQSAANAVAWLGVGLIFGRIFAGWLMDLLFAPTAALVLFVLPAIGVAGLLVEDFLFLAPLFALLIGIGSAAEMDLMAYLTSRYFGIDNFGRIYGYFYSVFMIGSASGPLAMGIGFDLMASYRIPHIVSLVLILLVIVITLFLRGYDAVSKDLLNSKESY